MKKFLSVLASATLAITALAIAPQTASADTTCRGTISDRTIDGNVKVPAGASCTLNNVRVEGNVQAEDKSARNVVVKDSRVDGNIQVKYATGSVTLTGNTVDGDIQVSESSASITINNNWADGNIQIEKNRGGAKVINANTIDGDLQCKENSPVPTGHSNRADSHENQCRGFNNPASGGGGNVDIYITPGPHSVNGRQWNTVCSKYSTTVERCTTTIVATQITYRNGRYVKRTGEVFNNLTYKASPRSQWAKNPLGGYGQVGGKATWTEGGRQWRTECDTATTGRGGCRNYVTADVIEERNGRYRTVKDKEVFNSMVRFS